MRFQATTTAVVAVFATSALAQWPSCANDCANDADFYNDPSGFCADDSKISSANSCIAKSSCSDSDKSTIYQFIAQACANTGATITAGPEATFSPTSGGPWPTGTDGWGSWSKGPWGTNGPWGSNSDWTTWTTKGGPWKSGGWPFGGHTSEWGPWASNGPWQSGPWTAWWGDKDCPGSTWSGWTNGPWGTNAPWTTWTGCTAQTTATNVLTSTISGSAVRITQYGVKVAEATGAAATTGSGTATAAAATSSSTGAGAMKTAGVGAVVGAAMLGFAAAL